MSINRTHGGHILRIAIGISLLAVLLLMGSASAAPAISASVTEGPPGTSVTVTGSGWTPTGSAQSVDLTLDMIAYPYDDYKLGAVGVKDDGTFQITIQIPDNAKPEKYELWGWNSVIQPNENAKIVFTVTPATPAPTIDLTPSSGKEGDDVKAVGKGWPTYVRINAFWDQPALIINGGIDLRTDNSGNFQIDFKVPQGAESGIHTVDFYIDNDDGCKERIYSHSFRKDRTEASRTPNKRCHLYYGKRCGMVFAVSHFWNEGSAYKFRMY
jgi:hypothetical protein